MATILIIDDEKSIRRTLREILEYEGYKVEEANDGVEGLNMLKDKPFDAILLDIKMPKMDGLEVLDKIQQTNADTPGYHGIRPRNYRYGCRSGKERRV